MLQLSLEKAKFMNIRQLRSILRHFKTQRMCSIHSTVQRRSWGLPYIAIVLNDKLSYDRACHPPHKSALQTAKAMAVTPRCNLFQGFPVFCRFKCPVFSICVFFSFLFTLFCYLTLKQLQQSGWGGGEALDAVGGRQSTEANMVSCSSS